MAGVKSGKIVVAGLIAGLVLNVGDFLINAVLMTADYQAELTRLGLDPAAAESGRVIATWVMIDFLMGVLLVWNYAAIRPRFGPGPRTALFAAFPLFTAVTLIMFGLSVMGYFSTAVFVKGTVFSAVNVAIGSLVGAWLYKEA
jgi:hypothetical protein